MRKPSLLVLFLIVFIDLVGFGMVLPLLPLYTRHFGTQFEPLVLGLLIGLIMSSYSLMQFLFAPVWGRLSDRIGRRPVLLVSTAGSALSYAIFAIGSGLTGTIALTVLMASRVFAGICGANITVAQAYIADISAPEERSKRMGLIGMAFGLGFIFGPALGGLSLKAFHETGPGWVAAALCAANFLLAIFVLPESWRPSSTPAKPRPRLGQWTHVLRQPQAGLLIGVFFLATFCFSCFETTLPLLVSNTFNLDLIENEHTAGKVTFLFTYCGLIGALIQGGTIGRFVKLFGGEPRLIAVSLLLTGIALAPMPFVSTWTGLLVALAVLSVGTSLTRPPVFGLLSNLTAAHEQGETIGVAQSAGSLARILGPIFAGMLFTWRPAVPYLVCGLISLLTAGWVWVGLCRPEPRFGGGERLTSEAPSKN